MEVVDKEDVVDEEGEGNGKADEGGRRMKEA